MPNFIGNAVDIADASDFKVVAVRGSAMVTAVSRTLNGGVPIRCLPWAGGYLITVFPCPNAGTGNVVSCIHLDSGSEVQYMATDAALATLLIPGLTLTLVSLTGVGVLGNVTMVTVPEDAFSGFNQFRSNPNMKALEPLPLPSRFEVLFNGTLAANTLFSFRTQGFTQVSAVALITASTGAGSADVEHYAGYGPTIAQMTQAVAGSSMGFANPFPGGAPLLRTQKPVAVVGPWMGTYFVKGTFTDITLTLWAHLSTGGYGRHSSNS